jgi:hypothetical protein
VRRVATYTRAKSFLDQAQSIVDSARGRALSPDEVSRAKSLIARAEAAKADAELTEQIDAMQAGWTAPSTRGLGDRLIEAGLFSKAGDPTEGLSVKGNPSVVIPGYPVFGPDGAKALTSPVIADMPRRVEAGIVALGADERFAFPQFPMIDAGTDLVISDYRQTVRGAPVGTVERSPVAATDKATPPITVAVANDPMSQVGIILDGVPVAVVEALPSFRQFADTELRFQLAKALDAHLYTKVNTGASFGNTGTGLIAQLRNAVAALQAAGYNPDLAIVNPADAVALDLTTTGADAQYVFALRDTGDSSPLWGLRVVVRAGTTGTEPPLVVDTRRIGALYLGTLAVDLDPYAGVGGANFKKNLVDIRAEQNALMHVRAPTAARRIAAT